MKNINDILKEIEEAQLAKAMSGSITHSTDGDDPDDYEGGDDDDPMVKSFPVTLSDGSSADAIDGTEMLKSFSAQLNDQKETLESFQGDLVKALGSVMDLVKSQSVEIAKQGQVIAALHEDIGRLRKTGKGPQSVLMAKAETILPAQSVLAKALAAKNAGAITSTQFSEVDASIRHNVAIAPDVLAKINSI